MSSHCHHQSAIKSILVLNLMTYQSFIFRSNIRSLSHPSGIHNSYTECIVHMYVDIYQTSEQTNSRTNRLKGHQESGEAQKCRNFIRRKWNGDTDKNQPIQYLKCQLQPMISFNFIQFNFIPSARCLFPPPPGPGPIMHSIIHSFVHLSIPYTTSINSIFQSKISYPPHICTSYAHLFFDCNISQFWNFVSSCALLQSVSQPASYPFRASNCCYPPTIIVVAAANSIKFLKFLFHSIIRCAIVIHWGCGWAVPCV